MARRTEDDRAFPNDTYLKDLKQASKVKRSWVGMLYVVLLLSALADWFIMADLMAKILDVPALADVLGGDVEFESIVGLFEGYVLPLMLIIGYIAVGHVIGKKAQDYTAFARRSTLIMLLTAGIAEFAFLVITALVRFYGTIQNSLIEVGFDFSILEPGEVWLAVLQAVLLLAIMLIGAGLSIICAYYSGSPLSESLLKQARENLHNDTSLYKETFQRFAADADKERGYEREEREIDERAIGSISRLGALAAQLNGILDPADAEDFRFISSRATSAYYG